MKTNVIKNHPQDTQVYPQFQGHFSTLVTKINVYNLRPLDPLVASVSTHPRYPLESEAATVSMPTRCPLESEVATGFWGCCVRLGGKGCRYQSGSLGIHGYEVSTYGWGGYMIPVRNKLRTAHRVMNIPRYALHVHNSMRYFLHHNVKEEYYGLRSRHNLRRKDSDDSTVRMESDSKHTLPSIQTARMAMVHGDARSIRDKTS